MDMKNTHADDQNGEGILSVVLHTLSTPALRIEFPFLFHLSANMGPLCCPKVLARFPYGYEQDHLFQENVTQYLEQCPKFSDKHMQD